MIKQLKSKRGFVSIETILSATVFIMIVLVAIGFFTTIFPRVSIQMETRSLLQKAKIQGGLTTGEGSDVERFKDRLEKLGYNRNDIIIEAYAEPSKQNALGVTPYEEEGTNYIKRGTDDIIHIYIQVPANQSIRAPLSFFGLANQAPKTYNILETTMSERW